MLQKHWRVENSGLSVALQVPLAFHWLLLPGRKKKHGLHARGTLPSETYLPVQNPCNPKLCQVNAALIRRAQYPRNPEII